MLLSMVKILIEFLLVVLDILIVWMFLIPNYLKRNYIDLILGFGLVSIVTLFILWGGQLKFELFQSLITNKYCSMGDYLLAFNSEVLRISKQKRPNRG